MPTARSHAASPAEASYRGKQTRTGNSLGFRFDRALFTSHPEFSGEVRAQVIAPGRMLVSVAQPPARPADPVMASFLAFLAHDIARAPHHVQLLEEELAVRIERLVEGVSVSLDEPLGEEDIL